jgi:hypothetical protein
MRRPRPEKVEVVPVLCGEQPRLDVSRVDHWHGGVCRPFHEAAVVDRDIIVPEKGHRESIDSGGNRSTAVGDDALLVEQVRRIEDSLHLDSG